MTPSSTTKVEPCKDFRNTGTCRFGDRCKFSHDLSSAATKRHSRATARHPAAVANIDQSGASSTVSSEALNPPTTEVSETPGNSGLEANAGRRRAVRGRRRAGAKESAPTPAPVQRGEAEGELKEEARMRKERIPKKLEEEQERREARARKQQEAIDRRRREELAQARQRELMESQAAHTLQTVVSGAIVTLGAGLNVHHVVTGFECCKIVVKNLPHNVRPEELVPLFVENGLDQTHFCVENRTRTKTGQEITVIAHGDNAQALMSRVDGIELHGEPLEIEMGVYNGTGGMGDSDQGQGSKLKITFFAPASRFVADYVRVTLGRSPASIVLNNLPPDYANDPTKLHSSIGTTNLRSLPAQNFDVDDAITSIRNVIATCYPGAQVSTLNRGETGGIVSLSVAGLNDHDRTILRDRLDVQAFHFLGRSKLRIHLPDPMHFTIVIPTAQYRAQATIWRELDEGIKDKSACRLTTQELQYVHRIQVSGSDKAAVGALKVRVEGVAAGTRGPGWHQSLANSPQRTLNALEAVGAWLKVDFRQRSFKVYGPPRAIQDALAILEHEIETLNAEEQTMTISRTAIGRFLSQGLEEVKAMFGEESISLDIATRIATFKGGDDIRQVIQRITEQGTTSSATASKTTDDNVLCQICYTTPTAPRTFMCQHVYCAGCLRHLFGSATDADRIPMLCMGDEDRCRTPFPIPVIQEFLSKQAFDKLLELAFTSHVDKRPDEFRRCGTPGCDQIYRRQRTPAKLSCPSCFSEVCAACGDEAHVGISCEEHRRRNDKGEHERLTQEYFRTQAGIKPCPRCSVPVFRTEGCNHMECKCGAHFCWRCLASFTTSAETYTHMTVAHGGCFDHEMPPEPVVIRQPVVAAPVYDPPGPVLDPFLGVDHREQEEVLREAAERRRLQQEREIRARQLAEERERQEQQRREQEQAEREAAERQRREREMEIRARELLAEERQREQEEVLREAAERRRLQRERDIRTRQLAEERERQELQRREQQRREQKQAECEAAERQRFQREMEIRARQLLAAERQREQGEVLRRAAERRGLQREREIRARQLAEERERQEQQRPEQEEALREATERQRLQLEMEIRARQLLAEEQQREQEAAERQRLNREREIRTERLFVEERRRQERYREVLHPALNRQCRRCTEVIYSSTRYVTDRLQRRSVRQVVRAPSCSLASIEDNFTGDVVTLWYFPPAPM